MCHLPNSFHQRSRMGRCSGGQVATTTWTAPRIRLATDISLSMGHAPGSLVTAILHASHGRTSVEDSRDPSGRCEPPVAEHLMISCSSKRVETSGTKMARMLRRSRRQRIGVRPRLGGPPSVGQVTHRLLPVPDRSLYLGPRAPRTERPSLPVARTAPSIARYTTE